MPNPIETLARAILAEEGLPIIWMLHEEAATLCRLGKPANAAAFIDIADAMERAMDISPSGRFGGRL